MGGRPIGFALYTGATVNGSKPQPLKVSVIYNGCNCPVSYLLGPLTFADMEIEAVVGPD